MGLLSAAEIRLCRTVIRAECTDQKFLDPFKESRCIIVITYLPDDKLVEKIVETVISRKEGLVHFKFRHTVRQLQVYQRKESSDRI